MDEYAVRVGKGSVYLSAEDHAIDRYTFNYIFLKHTYDCDYTNAFVLDMGAHKGYFGAYALLRGARAVHSFEPEERNFSFLERSAAAFRARGFDWRTSRLAVGSEAGELDLRVGEESWAHSLAPPRDFCQIGSQRVEVVSMAGVMEEARAAASAASRLVVKMNVEGSECDVVLSTPIHTWQTADEVFVETHPWARCAPRELVEWLKGAGFSVQESVAPELLHLRRT